MKYPVYFRMSYPCDPLHRGDIAIAALVILLQWCLLRPSRPASISPMSYPFVLYLSLGSGYSIAHLLDLCIYNDVFTFFFVHFNDFLKSLLLHYTFVFFFLKPVWILATRVQSRDNSKEHFGKWEWRIFRCMGQSATSEERLNRDKQWDKNIKRRHHLLSYSLWGRLPLLSTPQFHPKTEVSTVFHHCAREENPQVSQWRRLGGTDEGTDRWVGVTVSPDEPDEGGQSDNGVHRALLHPFHQSELVPLFVFALQHHLETKNT